MEKRNVILTYVDYHVLFLGHDKPRIDSKWIKHFQLGRLDQGWHNMLNKNGHANGLGF